MKHLLAPLLIATTAAACVVYPDEPHPGPPGPPGPPVVNNYAPIVLDGYAGVYWDSYYGDDIWTFEADVDDPDGPLDVIGVWADVYDERTGGLVESFELYPTDDPYFWFSDWYGSTTYLDPFYPNYTVDIVAYDTFDAFDAITVWADTY